MRRRIPIERCIAKKHNGFDSFKFKVDKEPPQEGGKILVTTVQRDECTAMCNQLFDSAFDGQCIARIQSFLPVSLANFALGSLLVPAEV